MYHNYSKDYLSLNSKVINQHSEYIRINKKVLPIELKQKYPNLKGIQLNGRYLIINQAEDFLQEYIDSLFHHFDLEELTIENFQLAKLFKAENWKNTLKVLIIKNVTAPISEELYFKKNLFLDVLIIEKCSLILNKNLLSLSTIKDLRLDTDFKEFQLLNNALNLENLQIKTQSVVIEIDFTQLHKISSVYIYCENNCQSKLDFSFCSQLTYINLYNLYYLPKGIEKLFYLQTLSLAEIGSPQIEQILSFYKLEKLQTISIHSCHFDFKSENFLGNLPSLSHLSLHQETEITYQLNKGVLLSPNIYYFSLYGFFPPKVEGSILIKNLNIGNLNENFIPDGLNIFEEIRIDSVKSKDLDFLQIENLINLKSLSISNSHSLEKLPNVGSNNINLNTIYLSNLISLKSIPESFNECSSLRSLSIYDCPNVEITPLNELNNLEGLSLPKLNTVIPKEIINWKSLNKISIHFENYPKCNESYIQLIPQLAKDINISKELKELVCGLILGQDLQLKNTPNFKENFLKLFEIKKVKINQIALQYLHLLNDYSSDVLQEIKIDNSICFLSNSGVNANKFREKLNSFGFKICQIVFPETYLIVVNGYSKLPEKFFKFKHYYVSESEISELVKDLDPGYIQTLDEPELENFKKLIYSNKEENDKLLFEMVKAGGIPDSIIPELIIVAKTSKDANTKTGLRKLLNSKVSVGSKKILSDRTNLSKPSYHSPFKIYEKYEPGVSISQMALTYFNRNGAYLTDFFNISDSKSNPNRWAFFKDNWLKLIDKTHYVKLSYVDLSIKELDFILKQDEIRNNLKRLALKEFNSNELITNLLNNDSQINELEFFTYDSNLSENINGLKKLKILKIYPNGNFILPGSILQMEKLKEIFIWSSGENKVSLKKSDIEKYGTPKFKCNTQISII